MLFNVPHKLTIGCSLMGFNKISIKIITTTIEKILAFGRIITTASQICVNQSRCN